MGREIVIVGTNAADGKLVLRARSA